MVAAEQIVARDLGGGDFRLRAVAAIFRAEPTLGVHQIVQLDILAKVLAADGIGGVHDLQQIVIRCLQDAGGLRGIKRLAGQDLLCELSPGVVRNLFSISHVWLW